MLIFNRQYLHPYHEPDLNTLHLMLIFNHNNQAILPLFIFSKTLDFKPFLYKFTSRRDFRQFFFQMALKPFV